MKTIHLPKLPLIGISSIMLIILLGYLGCAIRDFLFSGYNINMILKEYYPTIIVFIGFEFFLFIFFRGCYIQYNNIYISHTLIYVFKSKIVISNIIKIVEREQYIRGFNIHMIEITSKPINGKKKIIVIPISTYRPNSIADFLNIVEDIKCSLQYQ